MKRSQSKFLCKCGLPSGHRATRVHSSAGYLSHLGSVLAFLCPGTTHPCYRTLYLSLISANNAILSSSEYPDSSSFSLSLVGSVEKSSWGFGWNCIESIKPNKGRIFSHIDSSEVWIQVFPFVYLSIKLTASSINLPCLCFSDLFLGSLYIWCYE